MREKETPNSSGWFTFIINIIPLQFLHAKEAMLQSHNENDEGMKSGSFTSIDVDTGAPSHGSTKIKFGELADSIIAKDYCPTNVQISKAGGMQTDTSSGSNEQWKPNICMIRKDDHQKQTFERVMADERQMKNTLSISPRTKSYLMESPAYATDKRTVIAPPPPPASEFALDYYVKSRIAEAMRTEVDKRIGEEKDIQLCVQVSNRTKPHDDGQYSNALKMQENDVAQMSASVQDMKNPNSLIPQMASFSQQPYAYPYSALNMVPNTSSSLSVKQVCSSSGAESSSISALSGSTINEPKPLLSAQYDALSDED